MTKVPTSSRPHISSSSSSLFPVELVLLDLVIFCSRLNVCWNICSRKSSNSKGTQFLAKISFIQFIARMPKWRKGGKKSSSSKSQTSSSTLRQQITISHLTDMIIVEHKNFVYHMHYAYSWYNSDCDGSNVNFFFNSFRIHNGNQTGKKIMFSPSLWVLLLKAPFLELCTELLSPEGWHPKAAKWKIVDNSWGRRTVESGIQDK